MLVCEEEEEEDDDECTFSDDSKEIMSEPRRVNA